jgi:hypothetical protein
MQQKEQNLLLSLARESIIETLSGVASRTYADISIDPPESLCREEGAFVTLKRRGFSPGSSGALRGCIGNIFGDGPLYKSIRRLARESAFHDPRFPAVKLEEMPQLKIEISVLSIPKSIEDPQEIVVGRDGVLLTCGYKRAVFLPQVATEQGWDRETMLNHLAMKAGLYPTAWNQQQCDFSIFQAEIFEEEL